MDKKYERARELRKNITKQEAVLWRLLRNRQFCNLKFKRQVPIGNYIVDFLCEEKKLIIEADGSQHNQPDDIEYDKTRTEFLNSKGYKVVRFWNNEINLSLSGVYERLKQAIAD